MTFMTYVLENFTKKQISFIFSNILKVVTRRNGATKAERRINTCSKQNEDSSEGNKSKKGMIKPPDPEDCCMSGCANCVWIKYAEELVQSLGSQGGEVAKAKIFEEVKDPNLRAFIMMELEDLFKKKD